MTVVTPNKPRKLGTYTPQQLTELQERADKGDPLAGLKLSAHKLAASQKPVATPQAMEAMTGPVCHNCEKPWTTERINVSPGVWICTDCMRLMMRSAAARQTRMQSLLEVSVGTSIGFVGSFAITWFTIRAVSNTELATFITVTLCTVWSFVRQYGVRRFFEMRKGK